LSSGAYQDTHRNDTSTLTLHKSHALSAGRQRKELQAQCGLSLTLSLEILWVLPESGKGIERKSCNKSVRPTPDTGKPYIIHLHNEFTHGV